MGGPRGGKILSTIKTGRGGMVSSIQTRQTKKMEFPLGQVHVTKRRGRPPKRVGQRRASNTKLGVQADKNFKVHGALALERRRSSLRSAILLVQAVDGIESNHAVRCDKGSDRIGARRSVRRLKEKPSVRLIRKAMAKGRQRTSNLYSMRAAARNSSLTESGRADITTRRRATETQLSSQINKKDKVLSEAVIKQLERLDRKKKSMELSINVENDPDQTSARQTEASRRRLTRSMDEKFEHCSSGKEGSGESPSKRSKIEQHTRRGSEANAQSGRKIWEEPRSGKRDQGEGLLPSVLTRSQMLRNSNIQNQTGKRVLGSDIENRLQEDASKVVEVPMMGEPRSNGQLYSKDDTKTLGFAKDGLLASQDSTDNLFFSLGPITRKKKRRLDGTNASRHTDKGTQYSEVNIPGAVVVRVKDVKKLSQLQKSTSSRIDYFKGKSGEIKGACQSELQPVTPERQACQMETRKMRKLGASFEIGKDVNTKRKIDRDNFQGLDTRDLTGSEITEQMQRKRRKRDSKSLDFKQVGAKQEMRMTDTEATRQPKTKSMKEKGRIVSGANCRNCTRRTCEDSEVLHRGVGNSTGERKIKIDSREAVTQAFNEDKGKNKDRSAGVEFEREAAVVLSEPIDGSSSRRGIAIVDETKRSKQLRSPLKASISRKAEKVKKSEICVSLDEETLPNDRSCKEKDRGKVSFNALEGKKALKYCPEPNGGQLRKGLFPGLKNGCKSSVGGTKHYLNIQKDCQGLKSVREDVDRNGAVKEPKAASFPDNSQDGRSSLIKGVKDKDAGFSNLRKEVTVGAATAEETTLKHQKIFGYPLGGETGSTHFVSDDEDACPYSSRKKGGTFTFGSELKSLHDGMGADDGMGMDDGVCRVDSRKSSFRLSANPLETGGRQMRPRPLDVNQPLLILIEGRDEEYHDYDWGLYHGMWHQQVEFGKKNIEKTITSTDAWGALQVLPLQQNNKETIAIPSFRILVGSEEDQNTTKSAYILPTPYIRSPAGATSQFSTKPEYDMDEEDEKWLLDFNETKLASGLLSTLSDKCFERIMDFFENKSAQIENQKHGFCLAGLEHAELERDLLRQTDFLKHNTCRMHHNWIHKNKNMQGKVQNGEECCICNGGESSIFNPVFRCSGCHICVHQSCYGIQEPEISHATGATSNSKWFCRKCEAVAMGSIDPRVCCAICCKRGGALKPAVDPSKWAHVVCALFTSETFFVNTDAMEPVDGLEAAELRARKQRSRCWLCGVKEGCVELCSVRGCNATFHISCGVNQGALFELQHSNQQVVCVRSFCENHANMAHVASALKDKRSTCQEKLKRPLPEAFLSGSPDITSSVLTSEIAEDSCAQRRRSQLSLYRKQHKKLSSRFRTCGRENLIRRRYKANAGFSASLGEGSQNIAARNLMSAPKPIRSCDKLYGEIESEEVACCAVDKNIYQQGVSQTRAKPGRKQSAAVQEDSYEQGSERENQILGIATANVSQDQGVALSLKEALDTDLAHCDDVERVYWYWASKRANSKGPLLHRLQQEQAARKYGIFNDDTDENEAFSFSMQDICKQRVVDLERVREKFTDIQQQLRKIQEITMLIIQRERMKHEIYSVKRRVLELKLKALRDGSRPCFWCKGTQKSRRCTICRRNFCFQCFRRRKGYGVRAWSVAVKLPEFLCSGCQNGNIQQREICFSE